MKAMFGIVISMLCATSFLAANGTVDAKKDVPVATNVVEVKTANTEAAKTEVAVADEVAKADEAVKAKKAEETKIAQEKKSSCGSCCK